MDWLSQNWIWIAIALGMVFLMWRGGLAGCGMGHSHGGGHGHGDQDASGQPQRSKDPVNGKEVDTGHAVTSYYGGRVYYFESAETRQRFEASPQTYAAQARAPSGQPAHRHHG